MPPQLTTVDFLTTTNKRRGKLLPRCFWIALSFSSTLPFLVIRGARYMGGVFSQRFFTLLNCQLAALTSRDAKPISPFCLKTNGAPPSSTHACIFCNPPCANRVVFAAAASKIQDAAVALGASAFLHGWMPMANPWQCPTAINSGSMAIMVHFSSQESPSIVRCYKYKDLIS